MVKSRIWEAWDTLFRLWFDNCRDIRTHRTIRRITCKFIRHHVYCKFLVSFFFGFTGYVVKSADMRSIHNYHELLETLHAHNSFVWFLNWNWYRQRQMLLHTLFPHNVCYHFNQINQKERTTKHKEQHRHHSPNNNLSPLSHTTRRTLCISKSLRLRRSSPPPLTIQFFLSL